MPPSVTGLAVTLLCVGAFFLLFNGIRSFSSPETSIKTFFLPLSIGIGLGAVLLLLEHAIRYLAFPYPLDDGEGFVLNQAFRLASRQTLYPPLGPPPHIVTNYPPVFPALLSLFTNPDQVSFFPGRLIGILSTVIVFFAVRGIVKKITGNLRAGTIAGLLALSSPIIYFWGALLRVDVLATALGLAGLWVGISLKGWKVLWSIPFLLAALYTRQSSVEGGIAIALALFLSPGSHEETDKGSRLRAVVFVIIYVVGALAILAALQAITGGEFWRHAVTYTRTKFYISRIWTTWQVILPSHAILLILALFGLKRSMVDRSRMTLAFFFSASIATSLLSGKVGSDLNYFLNLSAASACLAGCFFADLLEAIRSSERGPNWIMAAMLLFPAAIAQSGLIEGNRAYSFTPIREDVLAGDKIVEILSAPGQDILSEDEGFCLLSGHRVIFNPFIMSELAREGVWDQDEFVDWIRRKGPALIMLRFDVNDPNNDDRPSTGDYAGWDRFTQEMENAIKESYAVDWSISPIYMRRLWFIYRPK